MSKLKVWFTNLLNNMKRKKVTRAEVERRKEMAKASAERRKRGERYQSLESKIFIFL